MGVRVNNAPISCSDSDMAPPEHEIIAQKRHGAFDRLPNPPFLKIAVTRAWKSRRLATRRDQT